MTTSEEVILAGYHPQSSLREGGGRNASFRIQKYKSYCDPRGFTRGDFREGDGAIDTPKGGKEAISSLLVHSNRGILPFGYKKTPRDFP